MNTRRAMSTAAALVATGVLLTGCGSDEDPPVTTTTSSAASTYDNAHAYAAAEKIDPKRWEHDPNEPLPADTEWATASFIKGYNK